jgi:hypothetical protein
MVTIISGLPRSGTSMMMQALEAGGLPLLVDTQRAADADNPKGYCEYAPVKSLRTDNSWLHEAEGQGVKVIAQLLAYLPDSYEYRVIFMRRDLREVLASQAIMLERQGKSGASLSSDQLENVFSNQLTQVEALLEKPANIQTLFVDYASMVREPKRWLQKLPDFLEIELDSEAMQSAVDPSLYRNCQS